MKRTAEVLETTFYLNRIRALEIRAYMLQIAAMVGIGFFFSLTQGATFKPFYLPMEYLTYVVLIMLIAMIFESFFFTILEIRNQESDSGRFITAKKASHNAIKVMAIAIVFMGIFANPVAENVWEGIMEERHTATVDNGSAVFEFSSVGRLGLTKNSVEVLPHGGNYTAYIFDKGVYYPGINYEANARFFTKVSSFESVFLYPPEKDIYKEYTVLLLGNGTGEFSYTVHKEVVDGYTLYLSLFLTLIILSEAWWFVYLQKMIKKYGTELVSE